MYKTREDVNEMIETYYYVCRKLEDFGSWIVNTLSVPAPGEVYFPQDEVIE